MVTTLRIHKKYDTPLDLAIRWYSIISILNSFKWSPLEIRILAFAASRGDISSGGRKKAFCELFHSTESSVANSISELYKAGYLVKSSKKTKVHPELLWDFEGELLTQLHLTHV